ncbi:MAG: twin-arginine translocase TatA/TatE family subunit [Pseudomonadota bacterium]
MGAIGPWQIVLVLVLAVLLFGGGGRISSIMGDMAKGLKAFRSGLKEDEAKADKSLEERADDAVDVTPAKEPADTSKS